MSAAFRFRGKHLLVSETVEWPTCGWTEPEQGWQGCKRDAVLASFDEEAAVVFRCSAHRSDNDYVWFLTEEVTA